MWHHNHDFVSFFLFIFKFFKQNWVSLNLNIFWYLILLFRNQIKHGENVCVYLYLICKTRYSKMEYKYKQRYAFFMENSKKDKHFLTFRSKDLIPRYSVIFPPMIWVFTEGEGDKIKSKQASKQDKTLNVSRDEWVQGLEIRGLEECKPQRYTVFNWIPKHLRYMDFGQKPWRYIFFDIKNTLYPYILLNMMLLNS